LRRENCIALVKLEAYPENVNSFSFCSYRLRSELVSKESKTFGRLGLGEAFWLVAPGILFFFEISRYLIHLYLSSSGAADKTLLIISAVLRIFGTVGSAAVIWVNTFNTKYKPLGYLARLVAVLEVLFLVYVLYKTGQMILLSGM
jgi:hypothetical protein